MRSYESFVESYNLVGERYATKDEIFDKIRTMAEPDYCFGLQVDNFDVDKNEYAFQVMWERLNIPDTTKEPFDLEIKNPDFTDFSKYQRSGMFGIYQVIAQAIMANKQKTGSMDVAYVPLKTAPYEDINAEAINQLSMNFPMFFMFTFLIPLYYLVSKLAEEKESKAREGMKMMGLLDTSYFLSWFVFYLGICVVMCVLITVIVSFNLFVNSSKFHVFMLAFLYGMTIFGFSLTIVAVLPSVRAASTAASLIHILTYFIVFAFNNNQPSAALKIVFSVFPNIAMSFSVKNLYHYETQADGIGFSTAG